jgi:hypothetical protein
MHVYFGKQFNATALGSLVKCVACEKCGGHFFYQLVRVGAASAHAPYYLDQDRAAGQAQWRAEANLAEQLHGQTELVPCPHCGHIQQEMIEFVRARMYRELVVLGWVVSIAGLLVTGFVALLKWGNQKPGVEPDYFLCITAAVGFIGLLPLLLGIRKRLLERGKWLQQFIDNAPPALIPAGPADENGQIAFQAAPRMPIEQGGSRRLA